MGLRLLLVLLALLWPLVAAAGPAARPIPEVKVWYQPQGQFPPVLVKWWSGGRLKVDRSLDYYGRGGRFRVLSRTRSARVELTLRDAASHRSSTPAELQAVRKGVHDLEFGVPTSFLTGPLTLEVRAAQEVPLVVRLGQYVECVPGD